MLTRLSLRLRVFLIFAGLLAGLLGVLAVALFVALRRFDHAAAATAPGAAMPDIGTVLIGAGTIATLGMLMLVLWVWFLFDQHVARPIETLAGGLRTGAAPERSEGRYLADLAPAARASAEARLRSAETLTETVQTHVAELAREKAMLESVLSDIGAVALMTDAEDRVIFFNATARAALPGLVLGRPLARYLRPAALLAARRRLLAGNGGATGLAVLTAEGSRLSGHMRVTAEGGHVLILRPPSAPSHGEALENLRRRAATLVPLLGAVEDALPPDVRGAIRDEGAALIAALHALAPEPALARVDAQALAGSVEEVTLGRIDELCLAADGGALAVLLGDLARRLLTGGRLAQLDITRAAPGQDEARIALSWQGDALSMAQLDEWLAGAPDPDRPGESGAAIAAEAGTGLWTEVRPGGGAIIMPVPARADHCEVPPGLTYKARLGPAGPALDAMTCVVFDTETTGLDPADRIVQIAGLRIMAGRPTGERFETLVNPGRPIPQRATRIHGITDAMVALAPDMTTALRAFRHFTEDAVLIAHNAPFDMGLLRSAATETGAEFPNRVLDTVLLSAMVWGKSAPHSLDALAERLGVTIPPEARHTAMGDAEAAAQIFLRLIPALRAKGLGDLDAIRDQARQYRRLIADANR